jgi:hypothetical protein
MSPTPDLDALYAPPAEMIRKAVLDRLIDFHEAYLRQATFFCLATASADGLDASPRGGSAGFVKVIDSHTVTFADWPGNNRIESMRNIQRDERVGLLFVYPGLDVFLRINGAARLSTDPSLLERLAEGGRTPKAATIVTVREVLFHCGKAVNRARLWAPESLVDRKSLPTVGQVVAAITKLNDAQTALSDAQAEQLDAHYDQAVRTELY